MRLITLLIPWLVLGGYAAAVTLEPGEYKLEWQVPTLDNAAETVTLSAPVKVLAPEQIGHYEGLQSDQPLTAQIRGFTVVFDESGGPQTGYDTAYLLRHPPGEELQSGAVDLSKAGAIRLGDRGTTLSADETKPVLVEWSFGDTNSPVDNLKLGILVQASLRPMPERGRVPVMAVLTLLGHFRTQIPSDGGPVEVQIIDKNANRAVNDVVAIDPESKQFKPGDMMALRLPGGEWKKVFLGKALLYDGKLYSIKINQSSRTIEVKPYSGETGILRFETRDGKNQLVQAGDVGKFLSPQLGGVEIASGEQVTVPAGEYQCGFSIGSTGATITFGARKKRGDPGFIATVKTTRLAKVESGKTVVFALGGPVRVEVEPESDILEWPRAEYVTLKVFYYAGEDELVGLGLPEPPVNIEFRDAAGRLVARARQTLKLGNPRVYSLRPPESLIPGPHWLILNVTPGEYQPGDTISANKPLIILRGKKP